MPASSILPWLPWVGASLGCLCLWGAMRVGRKHRLISDLPTSKTTGVFIGLVELKGTAESERPLTGYLSEQRCVQYAWTIEERWSRTVTETYTDKEGRRRTRTRRESGWTRVGEGGECIPFYLADEEGVVLVRPDGAKLHPRPLFQHTCKRGDPLYYGKGPARAVANSDHRRRFTEEGIPLHAPLYVIGQAREREDMVAPEIAQDARAPLFLISTRSEDQVRSRFRTAFWAWNLAGLILALGGWLMRDHALGMDLAAHWWGYLPVGAAYAGAAGLAWVWMAYNSLIELRQRVRQAWSLVDVQLKRRRDLIPALVNIVSGLKDHERTVQAELADLRGQLAATAPGEPGPEYHGCVQDVRIVRERYPELGAEPGFARLQQNLVETEQRIALARAYYNDIATFLNTRLERVPDRYVAGLGRLTPAALLEATDFERTPVQVTLVA